MKLLQGLAMSGVSGNMLIGALLDYGVPFEYLEKQLAKLNLAGEAVITELVRFRVLDEMLQKSPEVRQWGVTADKLYELAQRSTTEICGPLPYDQAGMETVYSKSFT